MTVNKGLSLREKCRLQAALGPRRGPGRQAQGQEAPFPPLGLCPSAAGRSSSGIRAAAPERDRGRRRAGEGRRGQSGLEGASPPRPAISLATATSTMVGGESRRESLCWLLRNGPVTSDG